MKALRPWLLLLALATREAVKSACSAPYSVDLEYQREYQVYPAASTDTTATITFTDPTDRFSTCAFSDVLLSSSSTTATSPSYMSDNGGIQGTSGSWTLTISDLTVSTTGHTAYLGFDWVDPDLATGPYSTFSEAILIKVYDEQVCGTETISYNSNDIVRDKSTSSEATITWIDQFGVSSSDATDCDLIQAYYKRDDVSSTTANVNLAKTGSMTLYN